MFRGIVGRYYTLHISVPEGNRMIKYESFPVEMKPVPPIDSLYYEKTVISEKAEDFDGIEGCQIYLGVHKTHQKVADITDGSSSKPGNSGFLSIFQTKLAISQIFPKT